MLCASSYAFTKSSTPTNDSATSIVSGLYRDYAWEVVFANSSYTELVDQSKENIEKYFSPTLTNLFMQNKKCVGKTGDACTLDFDPIFASLRRIQRQFMACKLRLQAIMI